MFYKHWPLFSCLFNVHRYFPIQAASVEFVQKGVVIITIVKSKLSSYPKDICILTMIFNGFTQMNYQIKHHDCLFGAHF